MTHAAPTIVDDSPPAVQDPAMPQRGMVRRVLGEVVTRWGARTGLLWIGLMMFCAVFAPLLANSHPIVLVQDGQWSSPLAQHMNITDALLLLAVPLAAVAALWRPAPAQQRVLLFVAALGLLTVLGLSRQALVPFITTGHIGWVEQWRAWQAPPPPGAVAPRMPIQGIIAWLASWLGIVVLVGVVTLAVVLAVRRAGRSPALTGVMLGLAVLVGVALIIWPVRPPVTVVYQQYRVAAEAGQIDWALHALIPFSPDDRLRDQRRTRLRPPGTIHMMGTTNSGADMLSNMIWGTRIALSIGFIATGIALCIGIVVGGLMGYFSGVIDLIGMRFVEIFSAIPTLFLLLAFVAAFGANLYIMMVIIGVTGWVGYALFIRAEFLKLRQQDFVQAARAAGLPLRSILFRHMLPNGVAPVLVAASFGVASAILAESTLSFLGIGLTEESSWGRLLNQALGVGGTFYWWIAVYPGLAIFLTVFAYILLGDALRDAIDPHTRRLR
jgi:peptide/nickel transport system permease protein